MLSNDSHYSITCPFKLRWLKFGFGRRKELKLCNTRYLPPGMQLCSLSLCIHGVLELSGRILAFHLLSVDNSFLTLLGRDF